MCATVASFARGLGSFGTTTTKTRVLKTERCRVVGEMFSREREALVGSLYEIVF